MTDVLTKKQMKVTAVKIPYEIEVIGGLGYNEALKVYTALCAREDLRKLYYFALRVRGGNWVVEAGFLPARDHLLKNPGSREVKIG